MERAAFTGGSRPGTGASPAGFSTGRFAVVLGLGLLVMFPEIFFGTHSFYHRDFGLFGYPLAHYHREAFWRGELPLWNPLSNQGLPFLAQWNTLVLYPGSLVYLLLPLPWSLNVFCLGHLFLAGLGMHALARHLTGHGLAAGVAGMAFAMNGLVLNSLMWPNNIAAVGWLPWVILLFSRGWLGGGGRAWLAGAAAGALQMLTGAPEIILFTWIILGVMRMSEAGPTMLPSAGWWRQSLRFAATVPFVTALAAVQLLPFAALLAQSHRSEGFGGNLWAMPGYGWASLFVPLFGSTPSLTGLYTQDEQQWTSSYYLGIGVLALGLTALWRCPDRRRWWLGGVAFLGLILALGDRGYVFGWIKSVFPMFGFARFPIKFVVLAAFAVPLLAALALARDGEGEGPFHRHRTDWMRTGLVWAGFTVLVALFLWAAARYGERGPVWAETWRNGLTRLLFLTVFLGFLGFGHLWKSPPARMASRWALLVLILLDGWTHVPQQNPTMRVQALEPGLPPHEHPSATPDWSGGRAMISPAFHVFLDHAGHPDPRQKLMGHRRSLYPNWNLVEGVPMVNGFFSLYTAAQRDVWLALYESHRTYPGPLADFLGVKAVSSDQVAFGWDTRATARPLVTADAAPVFLPEAEALARIKSPDFDPGREVILPEHARDHGPASSGAAAQISDLQTSAHRWAWTVHAESPVWVVIAQNHDRWWQARVDGSEVPLWRANHAFQALAVPAGTHQVELVYRDRSLQAGFGISVTAALLLGAGWIRAGRRPGRKP